MRQQLCIDMWYMKIPSTKESLQSDNSFTNKPNKKVNSLYNHFNQEIQGVRMNPTIMLSILLCFLNIIVSQLVLLMCSICINYVSQWSICSFATIYRIRGVLFCHNFICKHGFQDLYLFTIWIYIYIYITIHIYFMNYKIF